LGCDIHISIEKKTKDGWALYHRVPHEAHAHRRNYGFFGRLAGVRYRETNLLIQPKPKGPPGDLSPGGQIFFAEREHSFSYYGLREFMSIYLEREFDESEAGAVGEIWDALGFDPSEFLYPVDDFRVIFYFDS
jgi:hypothetical protein